jgi:hypothetical protein
MSDLIDKITKEQTELRGIPITKSTRPANQFVMMLKNILVGKI